MCESIGHRPLRGRCPKRETEKKREKEKEKKRDRERERGREAAISGIQLETERGSEKDVGRDVIVRNGSDTNQTARKVEQER